MVLEKLKSRIKELDKVVKAIEKKKGTNIEIFDVRGVSSITDYFIISTVLSRTHLKTLRDEVLKNINKGDNPIVDGKPESGWIVIDYGSCIVHLMVKEERSYYFLEDIWGGIARTVYHV